MTKYKTIVADPPYKIITGGDSNGKNSIRPKGILSGNRELMSIYVENSSNENDLVLDPFMGSGSTGIACLKLNRKFIGIEIDTNYFDIAQNRLIETKTKGCA